MELPEVESTNMYAMEQLQANLAGHGAAFFAHHQTAGRGQRGKTWRSEPGTHIAISVVTDCSFLSLANPFPISVAVSLATHDLFSKYAGDETSIKWPNDLYWRDRKAGGILIENIVRGHAWPWSVVGIGININQGSFDPALKNPVSLKQISGKHHDPLLLAKELCDHLEQRYRQLLEGGFEKMLTQYNEHLFRREQKTRLKKGAVVFNCIIEGVSDMGELKVSGGMRFQFGEVEWAL
jgi:BirA family biotin operon repressor/biotin-[acetyl-CoA-carboxylase] ligase